jgi:transcriptional regulator with XRE-family HTH domain
MAQRTKPKRDPKAGGRPSAVPELYLTGLAQQVGVTPSYLSKLFNGKGTPSLKVAEKLAKAMGITVEQLAQKLKSKQ